MIAGRQRTSCTSIFTSAWMSTTVVRPVDLLLATRATLQGYATGTAGGRFVFRLLNRRPATQEPSYAPTPHASGSVPSSAFDADPAVTPTSYSRIWAIAQWLDAPSCRVLISASTPLLRGVAEPYVPESAPDARVAEWLASPEVGLLAGQWAGYAACYRPTPLGREVVAAFLADYIYQRAERDGAPAVA